MVTEEGAPSISPDILTVESPQTEETKQERTLRLKKEQRANRRARIKEEFDKETETIRLQARENYLDRRGVVEEFETIPLLTKATKDMTEATIEQIKQTFEKVVPVIKKYIMFYTSITLK